MIRLTIFGNHESKLAVIALIGIGFVLLAVLMIAPHWWKKVGQAKIIYNRQLSLDSSRYCSRDGGLLVRLREQADGEPFYAMYIVRPESREVGIAKKSDFVVLPRYAYSKNVPPPVLLMNSLKVELDPELSVQQRAIEFNSLEKARVRVTW